MAVLYRAALPAGDNPAARETVRVMVRFARAWTADPVVARLASGFSSLSDAFYFVSNRVPFVVDPPDVELLRSPSRLLAEGGDCDDKATLLAALARRMGYRVRFRLLATDPMDRKRLSHVYVRAGFGNGRWVDLDPTYPGTPFGSAPASLSTHEDFPV